MWRHAFTYVCPRKKIKINKTATSHPTHCWSHHMSRCVTAVFVSADTSCWTSAQLESRTGNHLLAWHSCCSPMRCHFCPATWLPWAGGLSRLFMKLWRRRTASHRSSSQWCKHPALIKLSPASCREKGPREDLLHICTPGNTCHFYVEVIKENYLS